MNAETLSSAPEELTVDDTPQAFPPPTALVLLASEQLWPNVESIESGRTASDTSSFTIRQMNAARSFRPNAWDNSARHVVPTSEWIMPMATASRKRSSPRSKLGWHNILSISGSSTLPAAQS